MDTLDVFRGAVGALRLLEIVHPDSIIPDSLFDALLTARMASRDSSSTVLDLGVIVSLVLSSSTSASELLRATTSALALGLRTTVVFAISVCFSLACEGAGIGAAGSALDLLAVRATIEAFRFPLGSIVSSFKSCARLAVSSAGSGKAVLVLRVGIRVVFAACVVSEAATALLVDGCRLGGIVKAAEGGNKMDVEGRKTNEPGASATRLVKTARERI